VILTFAVESLIIAAETPAHSPAITVVGFTLMCKVVPEDCALVGSGTSAGIKHIISIMLLIK